MGYRTEEWAAAANGRSVLDIALDLHCGVTGSFERSYEEDVQDAVLLEEVVKNWKSANGWPGGNLFDVAVLNLIYIALHEFSDKYIA